LKNNHYFSGAGGPDYQVPQKTLFFQDVIKTEIMFFGIISYTVSNLIGRVVLKVAMINIYDFIELSNFVKTHAHSVQPFPGTNFLVAEPSTV